MGIIAPAVLGASVYLLVIRKIMKIRKIRKDNWELQERINRNLWVEDLVIKYPYVEEE